MVQSNIREVYGDGFVGTDVFIKLFKKFKV
jgi:hypothetical protein